MLAAWLKEEDSEVSSVYENHLKEVLGQAEGGA